MIDKAGLLVAEPLARFIDEHALPGTGLDPAAFWQGTAEIFARFTPDNRQLLARRDDLQAQIDARYRSGQPADEAFLREIGYLVPEPAPFADRRPPMWTPEVATDGGTATGRPRRSTARFLLNAANARWGSLYDALYGTDALGCAQAARPGGYDTERGAARWWFWAKAFLDEVTRSIQGSWRDLKGSSVADLDANVTVLSCDGGKQIVGTTDRSLLLRHNGLHIELVIDREPSDRPRPIPDGIADVILESAHDCDRAILRIRSPRSTRRTRSRAITNWLGLMTRRFVRRAFDKGGKTLTRTPRRGPKIRDP